MIIKDIPEGEVVNSSRFPFVVLEKDGSFDILDISRRECSFQGWPKSSDHIRFVFSDRKGSGAFVAEVWTKSSNIYTILSPGNGGAIQREYVCRIPNFIAYEIPYSYRSFCVIRGDFTDGTKHHGALLFREAENEIVPFYTCFYCERSDAACILHRDSEGILRLTTYVGREKRGSISLPEKLIIEVQTEADIGKTIFCDNSKSFIPPAIHTLAASTLFITDLDGDLYNIVEINSGLITDKSDKELSVTRFNEVLFVQKNPNNPQYYVQYYVPMLGELAGPFHSIKYAGPYFVLKSDAGQFVYSPNLYL